MTHSCQLEKSIYLDSVVSQLSLMDRLVQEHKPLHQELLALISKVQTLTRISYFPRREINAYVIQTRKLIIKVIGSEDLPLSEKRRLLQIGAHLPIKIVNTSTPELLMPPVTIYSGPSYTISGHYDGFTTDDEDDSSTKKRKRSQDQAPPSRSVHYDADTERSDFADSLKG